MILATRSGHDREVRASIEWGPGSGQIPAPGAETLTTAGVTVTTEAATALPAVAACILTIAEAIACMPLVTYRGQGPVRRPATTAWQHDLLLNDPSETASAFDVWFDVSCSLEGHGNAYLQKIKADRQVQELVVLDPARVKPRRQNGRKLFDVFSGDGKRELDTGEILHVRGWGAPGGDEGLSPLTRHRQQIGIELARGAFAGRFFTNDASPGGVIQVPGNLTREQGEEMLDLWEARHRGAALSHRPGILYRGATWQQVGITLEDAQFVESMRYGVEEIARIYRVPRSLIQAGGEAPGESPSAESDRFLRFGLLGRLRRIEAALRHDPDLFAGTDLTPSFDVSEMMRADWAAQWEAYHRAVQAGILVRDEVRAVFGYGPLPGGQGAQPQLTPVGGAPNPPNPNGNGAGAPQDALAAIAAASGPRVGGEGRGSPLVLDARPQIELRQEPITVNLPAPVVNVSVPEQTTVVQVQPTPLTIDNHIAVEPTPVTVEARAQPTPVTVDNLVLVETPRRTVTFQRDRAGELTGAEIEDA